METTSGYNPKPRVLVIDNDTSCLEKAQSALRGAFEVHLASSVSLALILLREYRYNLILASLDFPRRFRGLNLISTIKTMPGNRYVPVVGMCALPPVYEDSSNEPGSPDALLTDSFAEDDVRSVVMNLMHKKVSMA